MKSLRTQLTAWFIALFTVVGALAGLGTALATLREQNGVMDDQLRQIALSVGDYPSAAGESSRITSGADPDDEIVVHVMDKDFRTIRDSDPTVALPIETATGFTDHMDGDIQWRTFTLAAEERIIQVSQRTDMRTQAAWEAAFNTVLPIALLIPLSWAFVGFVLARVLRPLDRLALDMQGAQAAQGIELDARTMPSEIMPLLSAMNGLLRRQKEAIAFHQRFTSDAAHQLRTPVAALSLQIGNLRQELGQTAAQAALAPLERGIIRLSALIGQLLRLARAEAPQPMGKTETCALSGAVRDAIADNYAQAEAKNIDLGMTGDSSATVCGNKIDLAMLIGNLIENAVRYTPAGGRVDVEADDEGSVTICDTGPGLPNCELAAVFERFHRHSPTNSEGSGLGLSIVQALAARCGAIVSLENRQDHNGLMARVSFKTVVV